MQVDDAKRATAQAFGWDPEALSDHGAPPSNEHSAVSQTAKKNFSELGAGRENSTRPGQEAKATAERANAPAREG